MGCLKTTYQMPLDAVFEILVWLPAKSALRFKCVCKEWYNLIDNPVFANLHLSKSQKSDSRHNHALVFTPTFRIVDDVYYHPSRWTVLNWPKDTIRDNANSNVVGSCNGLVCFKVTGAAIYGTRDTVRCFLICNPTTRTFKSILPCSKKRWVDDNLTYGFGYDSEHDDYKIVVTSSAWTECDRDVRIFSLKVDLWSFPTPPTRVSPGRIWENQEIVIFRDNMLHYLASSWLAEGVRSCVSREYRIARFDVVSEKWRDHLCFPAELKKDHVIMGELDGWLYLRAGIFENEVWMMEEHGTWKNMFNLPKKHCFYRLIAGSKDGHNRLLIEDPTGFRDVLFWYDRREERRMPFKVEPSPPLCASSVMPYIASLVKILGCSLTKLEYFFI